MTKLEDFLSKFSEPDWLAAVDHLTSSIHEVDRNAVGIWFRFFPLDLRRYIIESGDTDETRRGLALQGTYDLAQQIDTSHHFLYGHRYWSTVKEMVLSSADAAPATTLPEQSRVIAKAAAEKLKVDISLVTGISAVALATLNQVGMEAFKAASGETVKPQGVMSVSPSQIVAARAKDDSQGMLGFLKTINKKFSVSFINPKTTGSFHIMNDQEIAGASQTDRSQDWQKLDERCWEGVVPVECLAASCGTCWVGILGGEEKLSGVERREERAMRTFGYDPPEGATPYIRLACQAKAHGNVSIVIPPWNGVFGKKVRGNVEELELEPVTTSAKKLRDIVATAAKSDT